MPSPSGLEEILSNKKQNFLDKHGHRLIRVVARSGLDVSEELFNHVAGDRYHWTPQEWAVLVDQVCSSDLTVEEFLSAQEV